MTRIKLSALMLGATALTMPLAMNAYAQQSQGQDQQAAASQQTEEMGACEKLYRLIDEAAGEKILEEFKRAPDVADSNEAESCALVVKDIETAGGISEEAVAEERGIQFVTDAESFRATGTVSETVKIDRRAIVEGEVLVRQAIPEVEIEEGRAEVQVTERPGRIEVDEQPASIEVRQAAANVRIAMPRPTITIEQLAPEIIITMPAPGVSVERDQPQVDVVMAEPKVTVTQQDPQVDVNVDARLVDVDTPVAETDQPRVQTRAERVDAAGKTVKKDKVDVAVRKSKPSIRFMTSDVQDEVQFNRAQPRITYQAAEPNVEVTFDEEPRVEIRQVGEPTVRIRRKGEDQAMNSGGQAKQSDTQQSGNQQASNQQASNQQGQQLGSGQSGNQQGFAANVVRAEDAVMRVERRVQTASRAIEQNDTERARVEVQRATRQVEMAMERADDRQRQELQALSEQLGLVVVALDEQDVRGAKTALSDVESNLQQNRDFWTVDDKIENAVEQGAQAVGETVAAAGNAVEQAGDEVSQRLSREDTNRLLMGEKDPDFGEAAMASVTAGDLRGADVMTVRGEEVGEIEEIASSGGTLYAIISHGGFLGIGDKEVAIPLDRIAMRGDDVILLGLTEEQLEQMPDYDFESDQAFSADDPIEIGSYK